MVHHVTIRLAGGALAVLTLSLAQQADAQTHADYDQAIEWTGTMRSETRRVSSAPGARGMCTSNWNSELRLTVKDDGVVEGRGRATLDGRFRCVPGGQPESFQAKTVLFEITGRNDRSDSKFILRFAWKQSEPPSTTDWGGLLARFLSDQAMIAFISAEDCLAATEDQAYFDNSRAASEGAREPVKDELWSKDSIKLQCDDIVPRAVD